MTLEEAPILDNFEQTDSQHPNPNELLDFNPTPQLPKEDTIMSHSTSTEHPKEDL